MFCVARDKFMSEMQPKFTYRDCSPFTKYKERIEKVKETGDSRHIVQHE